MMGATKHAAVDLKAPNGSILLSKNVNVDPSLAQLFNSSAGPVQAPPRSRYDALPPPTAKFEAPVVDSLSEDADDMDEDDELSSVDEDLEDDEVSVDGDGMGQGSHQELETVVQELERNSGLQTRKRKNNNIDDDLEGNYMLKIAREEEKEELERRAERRSKRQKLGDEDGYNDSEVDEDQEADEDDLPTNEEDLVRNASLSNVLPADIPLHETLVPVDKTDSEIEKASRTVFLANVSTTAITEKKDKKTLLEHMGSFLESLADGPDRTTKHKVESIRFRSTAYAGGGLPKKAAFAKKTLMDSTTKSTNAYVVYSTAFAAREAVKHLNASMVLNRHLRVDSVAHPAKTDHRRCVFVGNLGFVDDESMMEVGGENERKRSKIPSDVEEGLWRQFGKAGTVESVRVVRDEKTRVGKGFAYVQFENINSVEAALLFHEKKYPPMLPRILRVTRAKAIKKTERAFQLNKSRSRPSQSNAAQDRIYNPKPSSQQQSLQGRAGKLLGKAGAAKFKKADAPAQANGQAGENGAALRKPESFIFEGHRATSQSGKPKKAKNQKKGKPPGKPPGKKGNGAKPKVNKGKPQTRGAKRGGNWKARGQKTT